MSKIPVRLEPDPTFPGCNIRMVGTDLFVRDELGTPWVKGNPLMFVLDRTKNRLAATALTLADAIKTCKVHRLDITNKDEL